MKTWYRQLQSLARIRNHPGLKATGSARLPLAVSIMAAVLLPQGVLASGTEVNYAGKVVDEYWRPIAGARVAIIGTPLSVTADFSGTFAVKGTLSDLRPLEFSAEGCFARTMIPKSANMRDIVVALNSTATPVEGQAVDIAPFGYAYRKDAANNPSETKWLLPCLDTNYSLLCGFLWEEPRALDRVEVEFPSAAAPDAKDLKVGVSSKNWWSRDKNFLVCPAKPVVTPRSTVAFTFSSNSLISKVGMKDEAKLYVAYNGANPSVGAPVVRVYPEGKRWGKPQAVEIEWAFDRTGKACDGRIEAYDGFVGKIEPLESGNGIELTGEHHWRESAESEGRRGIRTTVYGAADRSANITVWTGCGTVTFAPADLVPADPKKGKVSDIVDEIMSFYKYPRDIVAFVPADLEKGPILVPSMGVFIAPAGSGVTARQFQEKLAAEKKETLRQRVRKHAEQSWAGAMGTYYQLDKLPAFPVPPMESPMQIDVPEKELVAQWRLGAWHLTRHAKKINDRMYGIAIWPGASYRPGEYWPGACCLAQESWQVIKALDLMGMHEIAEKGLNYWIFAKEHGSPNFGSSDKDGYLIRNDSYDMLASLGHGNIMEMAAIHSRLTDNKGWLKEAAPVLKKACEWTIRQRKYWNSQVAGEDWFYGLFLPMALGDYSGQGEVFYVHSLTYYAGLKAAAEVLAANGVDGAAELLKEAESWRQDLRVAAERSAALSRVVPVDDGTYRRYMPFKPYLRTTKFGLILEMTYSSGLQFATAGVCDVHEPIFQEMLDALEERFLKFNTFARNPVPARMGPILEKLASEDAWFNTGSYHAQPGYELHTTMYLALDDIPLFLRAMYSTYAVEIKPTEGYVFHEGPFGAGVPDKTFEEGAFLERVRMMLVMEEGESLWLARATPRAWLNQGQKISVKNAPTFFGTLSYEIVSDVDNGKITATVQIPSRSTPESVLLRFRHPKVLPIKSVEVNGKSWTDFDREKETICLKGLSGPVTVQANY